MQRIGTMCWATERPITLGTMKQYKLKGKAFYYVGCAIIIIPIVFLIMLYFGWIAL
tara:strand:+ start:689 stop:856 length:168 start_codon:yes stop_codon:yes gene_type:complete